MCLTDILIVEDDKAILRILELELKYEGYTFDVAGDGREGLELFEKNNYRVILLDIMLPGINGLELCRKIRRQSNVHIIMLTAKRDLTDRVIGLDTGADDYIIKPFEIEELLARIRSALRRINMSKEELITIEISDLTINVLTREVIKQGERIDLTKKEYELLEYRCLSSKLSHLALNLFQTDLFSIYKLSNLSFVHRVKAYIIWQRPIPNVT